MQHTGVYLAVYFGTEKCNWFGYACLQARKPGADSEDDDMSNSDDDDEGDGGDGEAGEGGGSRGGPPVLHARQVAPGCGVNRLRACPQRPGLLATWGDSAQVQARSMA